MSDIMKDGQCLMIKTKDRRKFFTYEKNFIQLLEFSKLFKAEVSVVAVKEAEVLELEQLAPAMCDATYVQSQPQELKILEIKLPQQRRNRQNILKTAQKITAFIEKKFLAGEVVSLSELMKKYKNLNVTSACLCNHIALVKKRLLDQGMQFIKVGGGKYRIVK